MKKITKASITVFAFIAIIFSSVLAHAQETLKDTLPESAYNLYVPKHVVNIYSNFVPYVLFGIISAGMLFVTYRYWADNRPTHHDLTHH